MLDLLTSQLFLTVLGAWVISDVVKFFVSYFRGGSKSFSRIFDTGGFPSSHTTLVISLFVSLGIDQGWTNPITTLAGVLAIIVMYDAVNLRYQAGLHAMALNKLNLKEKFTPMQFKERLGHTYIEVFGGIVLGVVVALISYNLI
jgi:acid phosphatase family membrane protein YuiD